MGLHFFSSLDLSVSQDTTLPKASIRDSNQELQVIYLMINRKLLLEYRSIFSKALPVGFEP